MASNTLTITDNRNAKTYDLPIENGTIKAMDLRKIKTGPEDFGLMTYDPAFMNTASCRSSISFIVGDKGILRYRGYTSKCWRNTALSWRLPTCCCSATCPVQRI